MSASNPDFKEPPWVYSPSETMDWIEATNPSKKNGKKDHRGAEHKKVRNMHIQFDLNVAQSPLKSTKTFERFLSKMTGNILIEEQFDVSWTAELILRALAKAKFKMTGKIVVDGRNIYQHDESTCDLRKTIDIIQEACPPDVKTILITTYLNDIKTCTAIITIKKIHRKKDHSIDIMLKGELDGELYHEFVNYLSDKLGVSRRSFPK